MQTNSVSDHATERTTSTTTVDVHAIRTRNRAERLRVQVVNNVMERLEYFGALPIEQRQDEAERRSHALRIVAAVLALSGIEVNQ